MYQEPVGRALAGDQDAYTWLYYRLLPLARSRVRRFRSLIQDWDTLPYEAVAHMLMHLDHFNGTGFVSWAKTVFMRYYLQALRDRRWRYNAMVLDAVPLDAEDAPWRAVADQRSTVRQLEAHIDATKALCRLPPRYRKVAVWRELYGAGTDPREMWKAKQMVRNDQRPQDHRFRLPGIVI